MKRRPCGRYALPFTFFLLAVSLLSASCTALNSREAKDREALSKPLRTLAAYAFHPERDVLSRICEAPPFVLEYLKDADRRPDYAPYRPTDAEMAVMKDYLNRLPALHQRIMRERLVGIYFIEHFMGSGLTEWLLDEGGRVYTLLILNPDTFREDISRWVTRKEQSCFIPDDPGIRLQVDCGASFLGVFYILLHEATHIVDYVLNITPYPDEELQRIQGGQPVERNFTRGVWQGYSRPARPYDGVFRKDLTFYGMGGGPKIRISAARGIYQDLARTPFASLYGSTNWAEDLADYVTFHHLVRELRQPYRIGIYRGGSLDYSYDPMDNPLVEGRIPLIRLFYGEDFPGGERP